MTNGFGHTARGVLTSVLVLGLFAFICLRSSAPPTKPQDAEETTQAPSLKAAESDSRSDSQIQVALTSRPVKSFSLKIDGPFRVAHPSDHTEVGKVFEALPEIRIDLSQTDKLIGDLQLVDGLQIVPVRSPSIWVNDRKYRGSLQIHRTDDDRLWPINVLPLEEYVAAVVDAEMPSHFGAAAREAQAIVARSYAVSCQRSPLNKHFDLYSTPVSQNYLGVIYTASDGRLLAGETPASRDAAAATRGLVCACNGELFRTYYSACCGGQTLTGLDVFKEDVPTLQSVTCGECDAAPLFRWKRFADDLSTFNRLAAAARTRSPAFRSIRAAWTAATSRSVPEVAVSDGQRTVHLSSAEVKSALGLPSLMFELSGDAEQLTIRGKGHGHGVGLCQWGAKGLAEAGYTAAEILQHYYPGSELIQLP